MPPGKPTHAKNDPAMGQAAALCEEFLEQCPLCHWVVDPFLRFVRISGNVEPIFGRPASELKGTAVAKLGNSRPATWTERFGRVFAGETVALREIVGSVAWGITLFPIRVEGEIRYAGGLARDNAPWIKAEQDLRHRVLTALNAQEFERSMLSRFLHDSVGQNLTAFGLQLDLIRMDLEPISPESGARLGEIQKLLEEMMEKVREYSYELNPSTVERAGLRSALDRLAGRIRERFAGALRINVDPSLKLEKKTAAAFYHIAQEAVENSVQHSGCSTIEIAIKSSRAGTFLEVRDNGRGFDPADVAGTGRGLGILTMQHYAAQAGLDLSVTSHRGRGTVVRATSPGAG